MIENFFQEGDSLDKNFPHNNAFTRSFRMHADMTYPDENYLKLIENKSWKALHDYIYSKVFINELLSLFKDEIIRAYKKGELIKNPFDLKIKPAPYEISSIFREDNKNTLKNDYFIYPRMDIGIGKIGYGIKTGGSGIHCDNSNRILSCLLYLGNSNMKGGELRLYKIDTNQKPKIAKVFKHKHNRFIASLQSNIALHDVNPITYINGERRAIYIAISCSRRIWSKPDYWLAKLGQNRDPIKIFLRRVKNFLKSLLNYRINDLT